MKELLSKYVGLDVQINHKDPTKFESAKLSAVHERYFTVAIGTDGLQSHYPFHRINYVRDSVNGAIAVSEKMVWRQTTEGMRQVSAGERKTIYIEVDHLVVYKGAVSLGVSIPLLSA